MTTLRTTLTVLVSSAVVHAQDVAAIDAGDVRHYAELLSLDEEQQAAALERYRAYQAEMREVVAALQDKHMDMAFAGARDIREGRIATAYLRSLMRATAGEDEMNDLLAKPQRLERELLDDVLALATTPEQRAGIERVERAWWRDRATAADSQRGDAADVVEMARRLRYDEIEPVAEILFEYEIAIDPIRRAQVFEVPDELPEDLADLQLQEPTERFEVLELRAKELNVEFASRVKEALPADDHERWDRAVREAFWPEPYRRSGPQKVIIALRLNRRLTDEDRKELESISTRYEEQAAPINRDWAAAIDAQFKASAALDWRAERQANEVIYEHMEARGVLDDAFERELAEFGREIQSRQ